MNLALFDLDYTLLNGDSDHAWGQFLVAEGMVDGENFKRQNDSFWAQYKAGVLDIHEYLRFALAPLAGKSLAEMKPLHDRYLAKMIEPMISPAALKLVDKHERDLRAVVTATNSFVTQPIAIRFGIEVLIGCDVEVVNGRYTGQPTGTPSFREGKIVRVLEWLATMQKDLSSFEHVYFYSDSLNDLPLLEMVTDPIAVNPDATLRQHAETQGWPILMLH